MVKFIDIKGNDIFINADEISSVELFKGSFSEQTSYLVVTKNGRQHRLKYLSDKNEKELKQLGCL